MPWPFTTTTGTAGGRARAWTTGPARRRPAWAAAVLAALIAPLGATPVAAVEPSETAEVRIAYTAEAEPALTVTPPILRLSLEKPGLVRWRLAPSAPPGVTGFSIRFDHDAPFDRTFVSATADQAAAAGPLRLDAAAGDYGYEVTIRGADNRPLATRAAVVAVREAAGVPARWVKLAIGVGVLFLLFDYIEKPLTRTYEHESDTPPDATHSTGS